VRLLEDELGELPPAGRATLRIVNVASGFTALDVAAWEAAEDVLGASRGQVDEEAPPPEERTTLGAGIAFGEAGGYVDMDAGRYVIEFRSSDTGDVLLEPMAMALVQGAAYTIHLFGLVDTADLSVIVSVDALVRDAASGTAAPAPGAP
jgi:hypothetical protein